ncbi:MAG: hypothetical protein HKN21_01430, partial [Candidatus Eisenbacteria bacterium]|nr:hypothetical protein [Candidatus Eisenbacteria bacterium]
MLRHLILVAALSVGPLLPLSAVAQPLVQDVPQSAQNVSSPTLRGISGITPLGGNLYMVVDDIDGGVGTPQFHVMTLNVNLTSGFLVSSLLTSSTGFASGSQYESIEFNSNTGYLYVCSEFDHTIRKVDGDGLQLGFVPTPSIYGSAQGNRSLESLAYQDEIDVLWTANEEELTVDSGTNHVRLQRFVGEVATEQYAYPVELP